MIRGPLRRWRERGGRNVSLVLPFEDVMEFALALLSLTPAELEQLGWTFGDRKRLINHFLTFGKSGRLSKPEEVSKVPIELTLPRRDVEQMRRFARRELPKAASKASVIDRVMDALDGVSHERPERAVYVPGKGDGGAKQNEIR